uniref:Uncharacterized protein n=1 Tax=Candidatus Kentrum sp. UNK TaxID=2126344 RepID=A0A451AMH4_9GAMM|nr:MAG: hypothetical protein BECKUNK1418G_GA0071005_113210 [Candidatus Kentron sp. UNK]VFK72597.1 MAG: hypothetical protein BECKUNK1418H_GA0071006_112410 [Candidatus Kentron sp. UNK]
MKDAQNRPDEQDETFERTLLKVCRNHYGEIIFLTISAVCAIYGFLCLVGQFLRNGLT